METRIYVVEEFADSLAHPDSSEPKAIIDQRLIDAGSQAQAIRHVVGRRFEARIAKASDVATMMAAGAEVEKAAE